MPEPAIETYEDNRPDADRRGEVVSVSGSVIDIDFADGLLPALYNALDIEWDGPYRLIVEVHQHINPHRVRGVALQETAGLKCGVSARDTGAAISVPVGEAMLGRMVDVLGEPIDQRGPSPTMFRVFPFIALRRSWRHRAASANSFTPASK